MLGQELPALEDEDSKHGQHFIIVARLSGDRGCCLAQFLPTLPQQLHPTQCQKDSNSDAFLNVLLALAVVL